MGVCLSCNATRHGPTWHGPLVAYGDEQHRQGPGGAVANGQPGPRHSEWMRDKCEQDPTVISMPRGLKYSAGHSHDDDLDSVVLVGVVCVSNASSLGRLSLVKSSFGHDLPATWISPHRPWRYHDTPPHFRAWYSVPSRTVI
jgi:hypothetical protein